MDYGDFSLIGGGMKSKGGKRVSAGLSGGGARGCGMGSARQQKKQRLGSSKNNMIYSSKHVRIQASKRNNVKK